MKVRIHLLLFVLLAGATTLRGQDSPKAILVDETSNLLCSDDIKARLDNFAIQVFEHPQSTGYFVSSADKGIEGRYAHYQKLIRSWFRFRRIPIERFKFIRTPNEGWMRFRFYLVPSGLDKFPDGFQTYEKDRVDAPRLFDKSWISSVSRKGVVFGGDPASEPCDFGLNLDGFIARLTDQPDLDAYLVAFSDEDSPREFAIGALGLLTTQLQSRNKITVHRIKTIYGGRAKFRQMQLWLVPKRQKFSLAAAREGAQTE